MDRGALFPPALIWLTLLLLIGLAWGQGRVYDEFDWRPIAAPRPTAMHRYNGDAPSADRVPSTLSYDSRYGARDPLSSYGSMPFDDFASSEEEYPKSEPYKYGGEPAYAQYGHQYGGEPVDMEAERYGGFGGTGDERGFGAYDYPKKVPQDVPQDLSTEYRGPPPPIESAFPEIMRHGGSSRSFYDKGPLARPLPTRL